MQEASHIFDIQRLFHINVKLSFGGTGGGDYGLAGSGTRGCEIETREKAMKSDPLPREKTGGGPAFRA